MRQFVRNSVKCVVALSLFCGSVFAQSQSTYLRVNGGIRADVSFGSSGGMKTLTVSTDGGDYEISFLPDWCSAEKYGTSFLLTCAENANKRERSGRFHVASGGRVVTVSVTQSGVGSGESPPYSSADSDTKPIADRSGRGGGSKSASAGSVSDRSGRGGGSTSKSAGSVSGKSGRGGGSKPASADSIPDRAERYRRSKLNAEESKPRRIDVASSFSYYFNRDGSVLFDSAAPATFKPRQMSNLSLAMGMDIYKGVGAYFDLGIQEKAAKKAIDWAGRIGSKYFDFQIEYSFIGGEVSYWEDANIGADRKNTSPDLMEGYEQTWVNVALMYRVPFEALGGLVGLFYNHANVPALIWVNKDSKDKKKRFAFLDKNCPVSTYGVRIFWDNFDFKRVPDNLPGGWSTKVPVRLTMGLGLGFADPDDDVVAMATEKGGEFSEYSFLASYLNFRFALGYDLFNRFTENNVIYFGLGFEFNAFGYTNGRKNKNNKNNKNEELEISKNWSSILVGGLGPLVRVGYAW